MSATADESAQPAVSSAADPRAGILAALARLDVAGAQVRSALEEAGIPTVLLKGRAFARRLYDQAWERPYADTDLLVALEHRDGAEAVLTRLGYVRIDRDGDRLGAPGYAHSWVRAASEAIDLHWSLSGATASPDGVWGCVVDHTVPLSVGGRDARVPDDALTALIVVLHAAHHGGHHGATSSDLERAIERIAGADWDTARQLADTLGAQEAFAAGLSLSPAGRELAQHLGADTHRSLEYRLRADEADFRVWALHRLAGARGWARLRVIAEVVAPPPHLMRRFVPLARGGCAGLTLAYLIRPLRLAAAAVPAVTDYIKARRSR